MGISAQDDHPTQFQDKIKVVQPDLYFEVTTNLIRLPSNQSLGIFVAHIPRSPRRPHMDESVSIFYRRGSGGSAEFMKVHEVREQTLNTEERLRKVPLFRLIIEQYIAQRQQMMRDMFERPPRFERYNTESYMPVLADIWHLLPPSEAASNRRLLEIVRIASEINRKLDALEAQYLASGQIYDQAISNSLGQPLNALILECAMAKQYLSDIFGTQ